MVACDIRGVTIAYKSQQATFCFFFSSRRRHTRLQGDWSSDVCSSDLIGRFQLVQDLLVRMLSNITACQCLVMRLSQMQDTGIMRDEHASLAKAFCTVKMREAVGYARELLGGNGILLDHQVGRFVADAEAIYSYEGTRAMNTLIVGKAITGFSEI